MFDIQPDLFLFMVFSMTLLFVIGAAILGLLGASIKAQEVNEPYWQVVKQGLRKFAIGVAIVYASIVFMSLVAIFLLLMAAGAFHSG